MRIAIIGPAHPYKGGIAQHTTELAHRLSAAGHEVELISWRTQYPFFYPGEQFVARGEPELPPHPGTRRALSWRNPVGWARWGRRLRAFDRIVFVWWVPTIQGPVYLGMLKALGRKRPPVVMICHNVLPHEPRRGDRALATGVLRRCDRIVVHSRAQAELADSLTREGKPIMTVDLPLPSLPIKFKPDPKKRPEGGLLFFGFIRPYKGVDILLKALAQVPAVRLTIAGEVWGDPRIYTELIAKLDLKTRVTLRNGYVPPAELGKLIATADAVVLPYKHGTATANVSLAHLGGTPVIATTAGTLGRLVKDNVDGLLCEPDNIESLAKAIKRFYEPGVAEKLRRGVPPVSTDKDWRSYIEAVTADF